MKRIFLLFLLILSFSGNVAALDKNIPKGDDLYKKIDKFVQDKGGEATLRDIQRGLMRKNSTLEVEAIFREMEALGFGFIEKKGKSIKFLKGETA